jgi:hypothetical protein
MTGLPKNLITSIKSSSGYDCSDEHSPKKAHTPRSPERFMECMRQAEEQQDKATSEESDSTGSPGAGVEGTPFALFFQAGHSDTHCKTMASTAVDNSALIACSEIQVLFEDMASSMIVMTSNYEQETTVFLDSPKFAASSFFGTRITIKEFSTAPKIFNIEIASNPAGLILLSAHKDALLAAFESHKLPFTVHRLDAQLHSSSSNEERTSTRDSDDGDSLDHKQDGRT